MDQMWNLTVKVAAQVHFGLQGLPWYQLCSLYGLDGVSQGQKLCLLLINLVSLLKTFSKITTQSFIEEGLISLHLICGALLSHSKALLCLVGYTHSLAQLSHSKANHCKLFKATFLGCLDYRDSEET